MLAMDSLSDLSFQNLMPTFRLEAAPALKVNMQSSSTESRAALMRLQGFVMDDLPFLPQKSGLARLLQNAGNGGENRFVNAKIT